jgi:integrase
MVEKEPLEMRGSSTTATLTGLEPATSAVTGRHANQLRYRALRIKLYCDPNGIRTRATAVKGRRPRPLNDGALALWPKHSNRE